MGLKAVANQAEGFLGTVTSVSVSTANGVSGSVANSTTTPAITLTLAAITPTTIAGTDATDSTSSITGAFKTAGGLGVAKAIFAGATIQGTTITATTGFVATGGTITALQKQWNSTVTWNNGAVQFVHEDHVITDTASAAGALAVRYLGGAAGTDVLFSVDKTAVARADFFVSVSFLQSTSGVVRLAADGSVGALFGASLDGNISRISGGLLGVGTGTAGSFAGGLKMTELVINKAATFLTTSLALTDGFGVGAGTILNAPAAGNPTKWIGINDNGTVRYIPAW